MNIFAVEKLEIEEYVEEVPMPEYTDEELEELVRARARNAQGATTCITRESTNRINYSTA